MKALDWIVIAGFAVNMLAIGAYQAYRTRTAEDYLLGNRRMNPIAIGLSLFATLMSTLSYLALPGEMVKHGPMMFAQVLAYPFVAAVVGWVLVPHIMRQPIVSAYELLETRLGLGSRLAGSTMFLLLRMAWMASIIFATADKVLRPMFETGPEWVPRFCVILGALAVTYTAFGGMRAVVITDAIQSLVMIAGAIATLVVITVKLGGVSAWWPNQWQAHWDPLEVGLDPTARVSILGAMVSAFTWHVCIAGSDQMSIQRYLATRDVRAARRGMFTAYVSDTIVGTLLGLVGFAILGYYVAGNSGVTASALLEDADQLFPRFVLEELPTGLTGLILAAMLTASVSCVASGINASCAVLDRDFVGRWLGQAEAARSVATMRWLCLLVGSAAVTLSVVLSSFEGNLLEMCFKVVNLLTAPIFVLFFLALFVRWSTPLGAMAGVAAGILVALAVGPFGAFGIGFVWMMPLSLLAGASVGTIVSLIPTSSSETNNDS